MINAQLLNSQASLNNYFAIESISYVPGENVKINIKIINPELNIRLIPDASAIVTMTFRKTDNTDLVKTATLIDADDRSMWTVSLTALESADIASNVIQVSLDNIGDGSDIDKAVIPNGLSKILTSGDC